jgi:ribonuclease HI
LDKIELNWKRMRFKGKKVWMAIDPGGAALSQNKKILIKYQLDQEHEYWVNETGIESLPESQTQIRQSTRDASQKKKKLKKKNRTRKRLMGEKELHEPEKDGVIYIYTDGASSGNPGPSGIGVLLHYNGKKKEISRYIGMATNNIAELDAIRVALEELKRTDLPVRVFTDSQYAYGVLVLGWKARKNKELVESIRSILPKYQDLKFIKVKGHAGHPGNERADKLATSAIEAGKGA